MREIPHIRALSEIESVDEQQGNVVAMVGSFAPIHDGHLDALHSASNALVRSGKSVDSLVLTPNSTEYLANKLASESEEWPYDRRIQFILNRIPHPTIPTYVDDVSGRLAQERQINTFVPETIRRRLGFSATQLYLVVGSDQLLSIEEHLTNDGKAICVLRPGSMSEVESQLKIDWIANAAQTQRLIVTERADMHHDISSTAIRKSVSRDDSA